MSEPTTTTPAGRQPSRSNIPVSQDSQPVEAATDPLDGGLGLAVVGVDHDDGRPLVLEDAHRGLLVADDGRDGLRQRLDASSKRTGTTLSKPASVNASNSSAACADASSFQVTPMTRRR